MANKVDLKCSGLCHYYVLLLFLQGATQHIQLKENLVKSELLFFIPLQARPEGHINVILKHMVFHIYQSGNRHWDLVKGLFIISKLFRSHLDERCINEILIKPSLRKVPVGMQFGKWMGFGNRLRIPSAVCCINSSRVSTFFLGWFIMRL